MNTLTFQKKTVNLSLHAYKYAIENSVILYRLVHAEELGFSRVELYSDIVEMDNVVGRIAQLRGFRYIVSPNNSGLVLGRNDVCGLYAINKKDIVLVCFIWFL